jgi:small-conductance mechanosensitive channel
MDEMSQRYPVPRNEVEPRVFVSATDNWMQLAARFVVPVRTSRTAKNELTRRMIERFDAEGTKVASQTVDATVRAERNGDG